MLSDVVITGISGVHTIPTSKGRFLQIKNRSSYALSFCKDEGKIIYTHDGVRTVSDRYCAVILPKGANYTLRNEEGGDFPIVNFNTKEAFTDKFISIPLSSPESYLDDFAALERAFSVGDKLKLFSILYSMLSRLSKEASARPSIITEALDFIVKNLSDTALSNSSIAASLNISEVYFRKMFKKEMGVSPKQYILGMRISRAKQLLQDGISTVGAVAEMCGFASTYHFSRAFKTVCGRSPSEYKSK